MDCETFITADLDGIIIAVTGASDRLLGYDAADLVGQPIETIVASQYCSRHSAGMAEVRAGREIREETISGRARHRDGYDVPVLVSLETVGTEPRTIRAKISRILTLELT